MKATVRDDEQDDDTDEPSADHLAKIADLHGRLVTRYRDAVVIYDGDEQPGPPIEQAEPADDPVSIVSKCLSAGHHYGDPSRSGFYLTRAYEGRLP